jgi:hypothetical protein
VPPRQVLDADAAATPVATTEKVVP